MLHYDSIVRADPGLDLNQGYKISSRANTRKKNYTLKSVFTQKKKVLKINKFLSFGGTTARLSLPLYTSLTS